MAQCKVSCNLTCVIGHLDAIGSLGALHQQKDCLLSSACKEGKDSLVFQLLPKLGHPHQITVSFQSKV